MRKSADVDVLDEIRIKCACSERLKKAVENYKEFIMKETLGVELAFVDNLNTEEVDFNGEVGKLFVERV